MAVGVATPATVVAARGLTVPPHGGVGTVAVEEEGAEAPRCRTWHHP